LIPTQVGDERIPGTWNLKQPVAAPAMALSRDRSALYLFSETWAGLGMQESMA
jgi:hypothetical protein